jgi:hypothetical protein
VAVDTTVTNYSVGTAVMQVVSSGTPIQCTVAGGGNSVITATLKYTTGFLSVSSSARAYTYTIHNSVTGGDPSVCGIVDFGPNNISYDTLINKITYAEAYPGLMPDGITARDGSSARPYLTSLI